MRKYDPVSEYIKSLQNFEMHFNLPEIQLFKIIVQLCRFFQEFSEFFHNPSLCFLHPKIFNCVSQTSIKNLPSKNQFCHYFSKDKDLLSKIGVLNEFQKYNLFGNKLLLFKSPKKNLVPLNSSANQICPIEYAFEISEDTDQASFNLQMADLKNQNIKNLMKIGSVKMRNTSVVKDPLLQDKGIHGLEDMDFLVQDPKQYFYKRWLWIIFPWASLYVNKNNTFSTEISKFCFDSTTYLSSKDCFFKYIQRKGNLLYPELIRCLDYTNKRRTNEIHTIEIQELIMSS